MTVCREIGTVLILVGLGMARPGIAADAPAGATGGSEPRLGFFVASGRDGSANLGGIAGADARCMEEATAVGAGDRVWRAYLSAAATSGQPEIHARERIGSGPWHNAKGELIARDLDELHDDKHNIDRRTALSANGQRPPKAPHDVLTGSDQQGRLAFVEGQPATCENWTSAGAGVAAIGHDDRMDASSHGNKRFWRFNGSWNAEHNTLGCSAEALASTGGGGGFYCFAADAAAAVPERRVADDSRFKFKHGLNLNHWLGDNIKTDEDADNASKRAMSYAASWFDEEDVEWIADHGYDHIRVWVAGDRWITAQGALDEDAVAHFDRFRAWAEKHGLGVVLVMHGLPGYRNYVRNTPVPDDQASPFTDDDTRADAAYLWWLITRRYSAIGRQLRFDLLAYPGAGNQDEIRRFNAEALAAVRRVDMQRVVYLTTRSSNVSHIDDVRLEDPNTALSLSFFVPAVFTRQFDEEAPQVIFPGDVPETLVASAGTRTLTIADTLAAVDELAQKAAIVAHGRDIYISTFGTLGRVDPKSSTAWVTAVRQRFEHHGLGWAIYDYHTGGAVRGGYRSELPFGEGPPTHIHDALFQNLGQ